ncbi:DUF1553 domain-containing protein [Fulvivirga sedimenti]|uniref:DUF1553 domain-containing protein n=1 Tax=Fulvivirga sedimenti TaxID=2879465 RepID=A0A9X1HMJ5_9BACT|nr:DUF1553 domain-containing protein [Fulvivirga sedimenti]MCA6073750.1 DUF1553 domain-containing protein [Fulvivirga sedimenti]
MINPSLSIRGSFLWSIVICIYVLTGCKPDLPEEVDLAYENLPERIDYNFDVKPILSDRCYQCHGPDENSRKADLRLDIEEEAFRKLKSGNYALVKGSLSKSEVFHRLISSDPEYMMPPPDSELSMTPEEIAIIAKWLDQGAEWKPHWSLIPLEKPEIPTAQKGWKTVNPIDQFIQEKLAQAGLEPSDETERERLIRRVTIDLTGLPPTVGEIDAFLSDESPDAYEKVVDRLMASDAYAERMTLEWLDVARYADSQGVSFDGARTSWPYRDWVISAFKENLSYDKFITYQLAGDLIENPTRETRIATAFNRMNPLEVSQGSIDEEFRVEYIAERTGMAGTAFLGLTIECARCHDHKFDPISQKEYYQLSAFFNTTEERGLSPTDADRAPTLLLFDEDQKKKFDSLEFVINAEEDALHKSAEQIENIRQYLASFDPDGKIDGQIGHYPFDKIEDYKKEIKKKNKKAKKEYEDIKLLDGNKKAEGTLNVDLAEGKFGNALVLNDEYDYVELNEIGEFNHYDPFSVNVWANTTRSGKGPTQTIIGNSGPYIADYRGWELALDSTAHISVRLIHRLPDDFIHVVSEETVTPDQWHQIGFTYDGKQSADGVSIYLNGKKVAMKLKEDRLKRSMKPVRGYTMKTDTIPVMVGRSKRIWTFDVGLFEGMIDDVRIFNRQLSQLEMASLANNVPVKIPESWEKEYAVLHDPAIQQQAAKLREIRMQRTTIIDSVKQVMVMEEMKNPRKTYILDRGLYNEHLEVVEPGTPEHVLPFTEDYPRNRLGLAQWLTNPQNPLTSRVAINRYWQMIFGRGLVGTPEDFGNQGERPTHPELLDWLAADFIENGWDVGRTIKMMVMSATYRQSSFAPKHIIEQDPGNIYLSHSNSYRWPAEVIRDNALAVSGLLHEHVGGPSVKPYQPDGLWDELSQTSFQLMKYERDSAENLYRRSLYTFVRRFAPHPFMTNFDATAREYCLIRRDITNSPLQALTLLNDPQIVEASRVLSERVQKESPDELPNQISYAFRLSTGMHPSDQQLDVLVEHYQASLKRFETNPAMADSLLSIGDKKWDESLDKNKTAALTLVANTILNYDESYMKR